MGRFVARSSEVIKYLLFIGIIILIFSAIPKEAKFKYEYKKNELWYHEDLIAPFPFAIQKTPSEIENERQKIKDNFKPYYNRDEEITDKNIALLNKNFDFYISDHVRPKQKNSPNQAKKFLSKVIRNIYKAGVLEVSKSDTANQSKLIILIESDKSSKEVYLKNVFTLKHAKEALIDSVKSNAVFKEFFNLKKILEIIEPNCFYNKTLSETEIASQQSEILPTKGLIQEGDKIITRGVFINDSKFRILESLKQEYELHEETSIKYPKQIGYLILLVLIIGGFGLYVWQFYRNIFNSNKDLFLVLGIITSFILIGTYIVRQPLINIYLVPFCIVPILLISFYEARIAFISHLIVVGIVSIFVPNSFEFLLIQLMAGISVVIGISRVRYLSHFFLVVLLILFVYSFAFFALKLVQINSLSEIDFSIFLWFTGSFLLTLIAYPLIYAFEKLFGFITDISLIEYSDLTRKLLKELSSRAPGTFQHSLQVANISEAVLTKIGGNTLLARVGSLYHDIGKMNAPMYFTENQKDFNPHEKLTDKESAAIIIKHVTDGVKLAKEHNLHRELINFIKTHHGTTRVEYFYRNYIKNHPNEIVDDCEFRYPGPKPSSKETTVVMIVDSIEAAARSLKDPTKKRLDELVESMVEYKIKEQQFQNANISLKEIKIAKDIIKNSLHSIYHFRIEYPDAPVEKDINSELGN